MKELFDFALAGANVIPTLLLIAMMLYWSIVLIGAIDLDFLDLDLDTDSSPDGHPEGSLEWLNRLLRFFNLGRVPLMIFLSFLILPLWLFCILVNDMLGIHSLLPGLITLGVGFWLCMFIAKVLTMPFVALFEKMEEEQNFSAIGKICTLQSTVSEGRIGQAVIEQRGKGAPMMLTVCSRPGTLVNSGETALVLEYQADRRCYLVEPYSI
ncbi:OB-fold-containig protein [Cesiribacter andamanensis]|uniref:Inner membrane protein yqiJ n=1 Tax=Cesiribacter andamanensis AMV16 TaxID=1279009 RepID=M7N448_9BACT|nr:OB-fold-containig protein [Cesiribacter andamanensis]EMR02067.1 hypothetical protein ADICEAN_02813 [Cesiribacter andamanensis AMV16]